MPRQKKIIESGEEDEKADQPRGIPKLAGYRQTGDIEELLNDVVYRGVAVNKDNYSALLVAVLSSAMRLEKYRTLLKNEMTEKARLMGFDVGDFDLLERKPLVYRAQYTNSRDYIKNAFVSLFSTFSASKMFYERTIIAMSKLIQYQQQRIKHLEEMLEKKELL